MWTHPEYREGKTDSVTLAPSGGRRVSIPTDTANSIPLLSLISEHQCKRHALGGAIPRFSLLCHTEQTLFKSHNARSG